MGAAVDGERIAMTDIGHPGRDRTHEVGESEIDDADGKGMHLRGEGILGVDVALVGDGDTQPRGRERGNRDVDRGSGAEGRRVFDGGHVDHASCAVVAGEGELRRDRMASVGEHGQVQMVDGGGRGVDDGESRPHLSSERREPCGGRIAVDRRGRSGAQIAEQVDVALDRGVARGGAGTTEQLVDALRRCAAGESGGVGDRERLRCGNGEDARHVQLAVATPGLGGVGPDSGEEVAEVARGVAESFEAGGGDPDPFGGVHSGDGELADADEIDA